ncbi:MAG: penicillin-binding protein 1C [Elusimicrobiaceae bacterium]|nr:penicillin-binding protein 1C [Elusimicrobiaceae bacterium]
MVVCLFLIGFLGFKKNRPNLLKDYTFSKSFFFKDNTLARFTTSYDDKYRLFIPLKEIPKEMQQAVILYEDKYFYKHFGVNFISVGRAFVETYLKKSRRIGASTITMQTARILFNLDTKTLSGKIKQILYAFYLEIFYSKEEILEAYLNTAPYGYNIEGVGAASLIYFHKRVQDLVLSEELTLAVIPQNPNARKPTTQTGYQKMASVRQKLFENWLKKHPQDKNQETFLNIKTAIYTPSDLPFYIPHVVDFLNPSVYETEIFTSIDPSMQKKIEKITRNFINKKSSLNLNNAAVLLVNTKTMQVEAALGSVNFFDNAILGQVNGFASQRMSGSTLKPFIYGLALDKGLIHPLTLLKDTPHYFGVYAPENSDNQFLGPVLAKYALINSRNIPAMDLGVKVGLDNYINLLKKAGVRNLKSAEHYGISSVIGSINISLLELVKLYSAISNGGTLKNISFLKEEPIKEEGEILSKEASFVLFDMLSYNPLFNNKKIYNYQGEQVKVAWKTGTSFAFKDAWAIGNFGDYVLGVWVGNFDGKSNNNIFGRVAAGELFENLLEVIVKETKADFKPPIYPNKNVVKTTFCAIDGGLPNKYCPSLTEDYFILGKSPIKMSNIFRPVLINKKTGLRACFEEEGKTYSRIYEFWPSDLEALFNQAKIYHLKPPVYEEGCEIKDTKKDNKPEILTPKPDITYYSSSEDIALRASAGADASNLYWFVDDSFVCSSKPKEPCFISAEPGKHKLVVLDDLDRYGISSFNVSVK